MKLAQQLRKTEAELDKVQRLHLAKSRRLMELEQEVEAFHGGLESRAHEVERISLERDAAHRAREEQLRQVEQLTPILTPTPALRPTLALALTLASTLTRWSSCSRPSPSSRRRWTRVSRRRPRCASST